MTAEDLAELIIRAQHDCVAVSAEDPGWSNLSVLDAHRIGEIVCDAWGATGSSYWKLGALDQLTQDRFGLTGPISSPLARDSVRIDTDRIELDSASFVHAKFEPEVGVRVGDGGGTLAMACVEVADSRFRDWVLPPNGIHADAALQAMMLFGVARPPEEAVSVDVYLDGAHLGSGHLGWHEAVERLAVLPPGVDVTHVATGSLTQLFDVTPGNWLFDFGRLGRIAVLVH